MECRLEELYKQSTLECNEKSGCHNIFDQSLMTIGQITNMNKAEYYPNKPNKDLVNYLTVSIDSSSNKDACIPFTYVADKLSLMVDSSYDPKSNTSMRFPLTNNARDPLSNQICASELDYLTKLSQMVFWFDSTQTVQPILKLDRHSIQFGEQNTQTENKILSGLFRGQFSTEDFYPNNEVWEINNYAIQYKMFKNVDKLEKWAGRTIEHSLRSKWISALPDSSIHISYELDDKIHPEDVYKMYLTVVGTSINHRIQLEVNKSLVEK